MDTTITIGGASKRKRATKAPAKSKSDGPPNFYTYIVKISKEVNDGVGVRKNVKELLDTIARNMIRELTRRAEAGLKRRTTIQERDIETAIKAYLPENKVRDMILSEADEVFSTFNESKKFDLIFSVPRTKKNMSVYAGENIKISRKATIYLAAALEQVVIELTEAANEYSKAKNRSNITLPDLERAVKKDAELKEFMSRVNPDVERSDSTGGSNDDEVSNASDEHSDEHSDDDSDDE